MRMYNQLNSIVNYLDEWGFKLKDKLCNPLSKDDVFLLFSRIGFEPSIELVSLYQWHDGVIADSNVPLCDIQLFPGFHFLRLEDAIEKYMMFRNNSAWCVSWFPLFANGGGDFYVIDFGVKINDAHPIIGFVLGEESQDIEFSSLENMINTYYEGYRSNIIFKTCDGYLEQDDERFIEIAKKYNPDISFWCD